MKYCVFFLIFMLMLTSCFNKVNPAEEHKPLSKTYNGNLVMYISIEPAKIELVQLDVPKLDYRTAEEYHSYYSNGRYPDGVYVSGQNDNDVVLKDGQLIVYNRFYEMQERITFKDSLKILEEEFSNNQPTVIYSRNYKDSIFITTRFYHPMGGKHIKIEKPHQTTEEYSISKDGIVTIHSVRKGWIEIADFWDEKGHFEQRERYTYTSEHSQPILQEEIDRQNKFIRKIR